MRYIGDFMVDDEDFERLNKFDWQSQPNGNTFYAFFYKRFKGGRFTRVYMHWLVLMQRIPRGMVIDHKDGNGRNNRKENLRIVTKLENSGNRHEKGTVHSRIPTEEENEAERIEYLKKKDIAAIEKTARQMRECGAPEEVVTAFIAEEKESRGIKDKQR